MGLIDRDYMRRDRPTRSGRRTHQQPNRDLQGLLSTVKPARLVPLRLVPIALVIGLILGAAATYFLPPLIDALVTLP